MQRNTYLAATALFTAVLTASGCTQHYNGSLGFSNEDYATVRAYHAEQAQRERELIQRETGHDPARIGLDGQTLTPGGELKPQDGIPAIANPTLAQLANGSAWVEDGVFVSTAPERKPGVEHTPAPPSPAPMNPMGVYGDLPGVTDVESPLDSTGPVRRVSDTHEGADFDVTTDPTGEHLVYSSTRHRQTSDIYRQHVEGSAVTQLTDDPGNDVMPCVSPDGKTIAFASDRSGNWDLYLMDAEGGVAVQLTTDTTHDIHPSFSPDGKRLVYCTFGERSRQWQMVVIDVANPAVKRYIGHGLFPEWSPTGDTIVYQRARERGTRWFSVWTVELNEAGEAGSPTEVAWSPEHACITPAWSPDGSAVVFCTVDDPEADSHGRPAESDVWFVNADGTGKARLTQGRYANLQPVWAQDDAIYFVSNRGREGVENIWALDSDEVVALATYRGGGEESPTVEVPTGSE